MRKIYKEGSKKYLMTYDADVMLLIDDVANSFGWNRPRAIHALIENGYNTYAGYTVFNKFPLVKEEE